MQPKVTAVIPCHNHVDWVGDAIKSVADQDYENLSIVVVDDGSVDDSYQKIMDIINPVIISGNNVRGTLIGNPKREIYLTRFEKAGGPSFARNRGMELAVKLFDAEIFALLDSDDIYEQGKVSKSVKRFLEHPGQVGAVYSDYDTIRPDGLRIREYKEPFSRTRLLQECIINCDSLVSRKAIAECDGFDQELRVAEDYELWIRISEKFLLMHIPESLVTIRTGPHSSTSTVKSEVWQNCWRRVMEKTRERAAKK